MRIFRTAFRQYFLDLSKVSHLLLSYSLLVPVGLILGIDLESLLLISLVCIIIYSLLETLVFVYIGIVMSRMYKISVSEMSMLIDKANADDVPPQMALAIWDDMTTEELRDFARS